MEILATCNIGWGMSPTKANEWGKNNMATYYPLGVKKDKSLQTTEVNK